MRRVPKFSKFALFLVLAMSGICATAAFGQESGGDSGAPKKKPEPSGMKDLFLLIYYPEPHKLDGEGHILLKDGRPEHAPGGFPDNLLDPVFWVIHLLSMLGLTLIIYGFIVNRGPVMMPDATTEQIREMINQRKFKELLEFTRDEPSFISKVLHPALNRAPAFNAMKEAMETAIGEQTADRFRSIEYLNIIGNLGPLLGLIGTVMGMIIAFSDMKKQGGAADPADLANGISKALTHTFLGLALAVPCLASFGIMRTMVDRLTVRGALLAEELLLLIKPQQETKPGATPPGAPARPGLATPQPAAGAPAARKAPMPAPIPPPNPAM